MAASSNPEKWECHICHAAPHLVANTTRCTNVLSSGNQCGHDMCTLCRKDKNIPPPMPSNSALRGLPTPTTSMSSTELLPVTPVLGPRRGRGRLMAHSQTVLPSLRLASRPSRPSTRGWWRCCSCHYRNNPAVSPELCANASCCTHHRCHACEPIRS